jgi:hypothetical protein
LADEVEGHNRVDNLCGVTVQQRNLLDPLLPRVFRAKVSGLTKLIQVGEVDLAWLQSNLVCDEAGYVVKGIISINGG